MARIHDIGGRPTFLRSALALLVVLLTSGCLSPPADEPVPPVADPAPPAFTLPPGTLPVPVRLCDGSGALPLAQTSAPAAFDPGAGDFSTPGPAAGLALLALGAAGLARRGRAGAALALLALLLAPGLAPSASAFGHGAPDLRVERLELEGAPVKATGFSVVAVLRNVGDGAARAPVVALEAESTAEPASRVALRAAGPETVEPGGVWRARLPLGELPAGVARVRALADPDGAVAERSEDDNAGTLDVVVRAPRLDLDDLRTDPRRPRAGEATRLTLTLSNAGDATASGFQVFAEAAGRNLSAAIDPIAPGTTVNLTLGPFTLPAGNASVAVGTTLGARDAAPAGVLLRTTIAVAAADAVLLPNLRILGVLAARADGAASGPVVVRVDVANDGDAEFPSFVVTASLEDDVGNVTSPALAAGDDRRLEIRLPARPNGAYELRVEADPGNRIRESSEADNLRSATVEIGGDRAALPDLVVEPLAAAGDGASFAARVTNAGGVPAAGLKVALHVDDQAFAEAVLPRIEAGETLDVAWPTASRLEGPRVVRVVADPEGAIAEAFESNNEASAILDFGEPGEAPVATIELSTDPLAPREGEAVRLLVVARGAANVTGATAVFHVGGTRIGEGALVEGADGHRRATSPPWNATAGTGRLSAVLRAGDRAIAFANASVHVAPTSLASADRVHVADACLDLVPDGRGFLGSLRLFLVNEGDVPVDGLAVRFASKDRPELAVASTGTIPPRQSVRVSTGTFRLDEGPEFVDVSLGLPDGPPAVHARRTFSFQVPAGTTRSTTTGGLELTGLTLASTAPRASDRLVVFANFHNKGASAVFDVDVRFVVDGQPVPPIGIDTVPAARRVAAPSPALALAPGTHVVSAEATYAGGTLRGDPITFDVLPEGI